MTSDGEPYAPLRFKAIIQENWFISKNINTSYYDILKITPTEKFRLLEEISNDIERQKALYDDIANKNANR